MSSKYVSPMTSCKRYRGLRVCTVTYSAAKVLPGVPGWPFAQDVADALDGIDHVTNDVGERFLRRLSSHRSSLMDIISRLAR